MNTNDKTWNVEFNIKESQPSHIMITWHPTFDIAVYVDDFLSVKSYTSTNRNAQTSTSPGKLFLGRDLQVNKHFGNITIDEFQIWDSSVKNDSNNSTGLLFSYRHTNLISFRIERDFICALCLSGNNRTTVLLCWQKSK